MSPPSQVSGTGYLKAINATLQKGVLRNTGTKILNSSEQGDDDGGEHRARGTVWNTPQKYSHFSFCAQQGKQKLHSPNSSKLAWLQCNTKIHPWGVYSDPSMLTAQPRGPWDAHTSKNESKDSLPPPGPCQAASLTHTRHPSQEKFAF